LAYHQGEGVPKDAAKAVEWYQKSAAQGNADAQNNLGWAYAHGEGVAKDAVLAYAWFNLAASNGFDSATNARDIESSLTPTQRAEAERLSTRWQRGQILVR